MATWSVHLTPAAEKVLKEMRDTCGLSIDDMFRYSLLLMNIYTTAIKEDKQVCLVKSGEETIVIKLPLFIKE